MAKYGRSCFKNEKERLQYLINNKETEYADSIYLNPIKEYIDPKTNIREKEVFFKDTIQNFNTILKLICVQFMTI